VVALSAPVVFDPVVAREPVQPPDAVQAVALVEVQVSVELPPLATLVGLALTETLGAGAETVTVTDCAAEPPAPVQVRVNVVLAVRAGVVLEPLVPSLPLQPPEAVHEVAWVEDQLKTVVAPLFTVVGLADSVTAGAGVVTDTVADCAALPPAPVQESP
jgi:hypothetical protein